MKNNIHAYFLKTFLSALFMVWASLLMAQTKNISNGNQQWLQYYNQVKLTEKWTWLSDIGYRWRDGFEASTQYVVRTGLGYTLKQNLKISAGFAHLGFYTAGDVDRVEFRPYQEIILEHELNKIGINHRYRIEERFLNQVVDGELEKPGAFNFRFRYAVGISIPLFTLSRNHPDLKFLLNIGNEIFINGGKEIVNNVFDQNRFTVSPTIPFNKNLALSFTWNSQFAASSNAGNYIYTNVIWLQLKHKMDFTHKKSEKSYAQFDRCLWSEWSALHP